MDPLTQKYYSEKVSDATELYGTLKKGGIQDYFSRAFTPGSRILEIGAGSGRDLDALTRAGYDASGIDASGEMLEQALRRYPHLVGKYIPGSLPSDKSFFETPFNGILCSAVLMHIADDQLLDAVYTIKRNLKPGGTLLLSTPGKRHEVDGDNRLPDGRLFIIRPPEFYSLFFERVGFREILADEVSDALGRPGVRWSIQVFRRESEMLRSLDRIESVLNRDKKTATYKLALMRALADIALTGYNSALWYPHGRVGVPIKRIAAVRATGWSPQLEAA